MSGEHSASERRIEAVEKQRQAVELKKAGVSYDKIAETLGYASRSGAYKAVHSALMRSIREPADELRTMQIARLEDLLASIWMTAKGGNLQAHDRALRIIERMCKLLGLDAPTKIDIVEYVREKARSAGFTDEDIEQAVREAEAQVRGG